MFKKSRWKIVASIMTVLVILWVGTLAVIYTSSYIEMSEHNKKMLIEHSEMHMLNNDFEKLPPSLPKPEKGKHDFSQTPEFMLSTFYTVAFSENGDILEIKNDLQSVHSDEELINLATELIKSEKNTGSKKSLFYHISDKGDYILVSFMDNTITHKNMSTLFRYTLIFGLIALVLFFFVAVYLAKKIVAPLEESYSKQKQFVSDAGHELKTPVSVISANSDLLLREIGENKWLSNIQYENERMSKLVSQLLELAKAENVNSVTEELNFSRLVNGEVLPFESVAFEKGFELITAIEDNIIIEGNSAQLKQLVSILIDNAIRHSENGNEIKIRIFKEHKFACLSVKNKGNEIPREKREKLFERFYRIDESRSGAENHYGLGLSIAKSIVESHKGNIDVLCYDGFIEFKIKIPI